MKAIGILNKFSFISNIFIFILNKIFFINYIIFFIKHRDNITNYFISFKYVFSGLISFIIYTIQVFLVSYLIYHFVKIEILAFAVLFLGIIIQSILTINEIIRLIFLDMKNVVKEGNSKLIDAFAMMYYPYVVLILPSLILCYATSYWVLQCTSKSGMTFYQSLYFSVTTITTLGYGEITPEGFCQALAVSEAYIGITLMPLLFASLFYGVTKFNEYHEKE